MIIELGIQFSTVVKSPCLSDAWMIIWFVRPSAKQKQGAPDGARKLTPPSHRPMSQSILDRQPLMDCNLYCRMCLVPGLAVDERPLPSGPSTHFLCFCQPRVGRVTALAWFRMSWSVSLIPTLSVPVPRPSRSWRFWGFPPSRLGY